MNTRFNKSSNRNLAQTGSVLAWMGLQPRRRIETRELTTRFVVLHLIALAAILRLFMLTSQSMWLDEGASLAMTDSGSLKETFHELWSISGGDKYQVSYFFLLALWRSAAGDSQFTLQLLSVIPGLLTPVLIYFSVRRLFDHSHAISSALFLGCSAFCVSFSQEVRPYAFLLCVAALQLLVLVPGLKSDRFTRRNQILFAAITLISCISSIFLTIFTFSLAMAHIVAFRDVKSWLRWWVPAVIASVPAIFYYASTPAVADITIDAINHSDIPLGQNILYSLYSHLAGQTYGPSVNELRVIDSLPTLMLEHAFSLSVLIVICTVLGYTTLISLINHKTRSIQYCTKLFFLMLFVIAFAAAALFASVSSINWMPRHSFYLMIPLSVLLPIGAMVGSGITVRSDDTKTNQSNLRHFRIPGWAFVGLLGINLYSTYNYFYKSEHRQDDYRSAAAYLNTHVGDQDTSLMLWGEPYLLSYYGHPEIKSLWRLEDPVQIIEKIDELSTENNALFVSINRYASWARHSQTLRNMLEDTYDIELIAQFINFDIYSYERKEWHSERTVLQTVANTSAVPEESLSQQ